MLTKSHAEAIAKKLKARIVPKGAHDLAVIEHQGQRITQFGIRRGSNANQSHDHLPGSLYVGPHDALNLARCPVSLADWIQRMKDKGLIIKPNKESVE